VKIKTLRLDQRKVFHLPPQIYLIEQREFSIHRREGDAGERELAEVGEQVAGDDGPFGGELVAGGQGRTVDFIRPGVVAELGSLPPCPARPPRPIMIELKADLLPPLLLPGESPPTRIGW
jgi:hypothetical protein